jgi:hypothetical protein
LDSYGAAGDRFLERIVMGDETWIHPFEPESKFQSKGLGASNPVLINQSNARVWNGNILIRPPSKSLKRNNRRAYAYRFWDTRTTTGKLSREDEQCSLQ